MHNSKIKTIDINCKEWTDKINGNSYFAGSITLNYQLENEKIFTIPFQYGYGHDYEQEAMHLLTECNQISLTYDSNLQHYCKLNNIPFRSNIQKNCLKRELLYYK